MAKSGGASAELVAKGSNAQLGAGAFSQAGEIYPDGAEEGRRAALGSPPLIVAMSFQQAIPQRVARQQ